MPPVANLMRLCVETPQLEAPLHGFLTSALPVEEATDRWEGGLSFEPWPAPRPDLWDPGSAGADRTKSVAVDDHPSVVVDPFVVELPLHESTYGGPSWAELRRRALASLDLSLSWAIERELWAGAGGVVSTSLVGAGATVLHAAAVSPSVGLALLSEALGDTYGGVLGMIHLPAAVASLIVGGTGDSVAMTGRRLSTRARGDYVSVGSGYPGRSGPAGDVNATIAAGVLERWVFATPTFSYRLGAPVVIPETEAEGLTRTTNDLEVRAEQIVALSPATPLAGRIFAVRVTLA